MAKTKNKPTKETIQMDKSDEVLVEVKQKKKDKNSAEISTKVDKKKAKTKKKKNDKPRRNYGKEVISELKKVNWPTFAQVAKKTGVVLVVVLVFAAALLGIHKLLEVIYMLFINSLV